MKKTSGTGGLARGVNAAVAVMVLVVLPLSLMGGMSGFIGNAIMGLHVVSSLPTRDAPSVVTENLVSVVFPSSLLVIDEF